MRMNKTVRFSLNDRHQNV
jgi:hypothetical protein